MVLFYPMTQKFPGCSKFSACVQKYYIRFLSYDTTNFQVAWSFRHVSGSFEHVLENFQISKNIWHLSGNFHYVSIFFLNKNEFYCVFYHMPSKIPIYKSFPACVWNFFVVHKDNIIFYHITQNNSGLLKNFRIAMFPCYRGFSLSA